MPAAAVIPAPIAYIKVVAVKKLVVGFLYGRSVPILWMGVAAFFASSGVGAPHLTVRTFVLWAFTLRKRECSKQATA